MSSKTKIVFLIMPQVNLLDLGCISQIFLGAQLAGFNCELEFCTTESDIISSVQLPLGKIKNFTRAILKNGDYIIVISSFYKYILSNDFKPSVKLLQWLKTNYDAGVTICSLCNASLLLAKAGLLDNKKCTTNWLRTEALRKTAPKAKIIENILFYEDNGIITGAGGTACFDLGLYIISKLGGGKMAYEISRRLVLYNIRKGNEQQISIFLKYRNHIHEGIHKVQDYLSDNINQVKTLNDLAELANMSERNFSRVFKKETGKTVKEFITELRMEKANQFLNIPDYSKIQIANECGLQSERHLRRIIKKSKNG
jgi:transcriptional regulator GlxA family with amidase domain